MIYTHKEPFIDMEHSAKITLPAMSCLYFRYKPMKEPAKGQKKAKSRRK